MSKTLLLFISLTLTSYLLASCSKEDQEVVASESDAIYAKDFSLPSLNGDKRVELRGFQGKPVVINFWASWCGPCRDEMPFLEKAWKEYKEKGVVFIGIDVLDDEKNAKDFLSSLGVSYTNLKDQSGEVANMYGVVGLPATIFINREGKMTRINYGPFLGEKGEKSFIQSVEEIAK